MQRNKKLVSLFLDDIGSNDFLKYQKDSSRNKVSKCLRTNMADEIICIAGVPQYLQIGKDGSTNATDDGFGLNGTCSHIQ